MNPRLTVAGLAVTATVVTGVAAGAAAGAPASVHPAASLSSGIAMIGLEDLKVEVFGSVSGGSPNKIGTASDRYLSEAEGTAIGTSGRASLVAGDLSAIAPLDHATSHPKFGSLLDLNQFQAEGASDFHFYAEGVAIRGGSALVASDSLGVAALIWKHGQWRLDSRVHSPGNNDAGFKRHRGFLRFPLPKNSDADEYPAVVISPGELPNGRVLAIAADRDDGSIAVIDGVGTAHPTVAVATDEAYGPTEADFGPFHGNGGYAFSPATPRRAVVATSTGFSVINLSNPKKPKLQSATAVGSPDGAESISVSANGDVVAEAVDDLVYIYNGLLSTPAAQPLHLVTTIDAGDSSGAITDVAYLANNVLAVVHGDSGGWHLTAYKHATGASPTPGTTANLAGEPETSDSLSVWPGAKTPHLPAHLLGGTRVGHHASQQLKVSGGIGHYTFKVDGKLPAGLKLHGSTISGTPKHAGTSHVTIIATNQYGGAVSKTYAITVH